MREMQRKMARKQLDEEMRPFRRAGAQMNSTSELLRAVRQTLNVPVTEIAARMEVNRSVVFELEESEGRRTITLRSMARMAAAMGCKVVYGVVPERGKTLEELAEERLWRAVLKGESEI